MSHPPPIVEPATSADGASFSGAGVLSPIPGVFGKLASNEAVKVLLYAADGFGNPLSDPLLMYDAANCNFATLKRPRRRVGSLACDAAMAVRPGTAPGADIK